MSADYIRCEPDPTGVTPKPTSSVISSPQNLCTRTPTHKSTALCLLGDTRDSNEGMEGRGAFSCLDTWE